ncbi:WS/DGAT/MGAT family acyltransferase [Saccharomonospora amisosensis]|uniref:Diacylglycerol O-acyltransferase n=1 Tax=Saccharomonospora amisosensis TaxID=1128677 RepID=A0A7X5ZPV9_9PSEU|nr:wax ester/triacylglycerol synthase family O-acyltransferase [Saccharomonospora amisosensis]NIJ11183.1 WS/DGAT/MGAT family acyltransferase [Saccharomonospora amisosensis]
MPSDRLSALDVAFLCLEGDTTPMHMAAVATFQPPAALDLGRLRDLLATRAARLPVLRKRVHSSWPPFGGARWREDPGFDPDRHIAVETLRDTYGPDALAEFTSEWIATPLDPRAPLWNIQLVSGLPNSEFAMLLKFHHALTDGTGAVEAAFGLLDDILPGQQARSTRQRPARQPTGAERDPQRSPLHLLRDTASTVLGNATESAGIAKAVLRAARPYPISPTVTLNSRQRRLAFVRADLSDVKRVRKTYGGTGNDVILAVLAGALREWMLNRGMRPDARTLRALVPVSTRGRAAADGGNLLSGYLCDLPVEVDDPVERLCAVRETMESNKRAGPYRGAGALPVLANRLPCGVHRLATKAAGRAAPLLFDTVVTNVPLPGLPLSLGGARLREVYPFVPLAPHQALGIAVSTYRDSLHVGLQANASAVPDVGSLADAVGKSLAALYQRCP